MALTLHLVAAPSAGSIAAHVKRQPGLSVASFNNLVYLTARNNAKYSTVQPLATCRNQGPNGTINVEQAKENHPLSQRVRHGTHNFRRRRGDTPSVFPDYWDPFPAGSLRQMMDFIDDVFLDATSSGNTSRRIGDRVRRTPWEIVEEEEAFHIRVDMPGFGKEDVKVTVEDGILAITGERDSKVQADERWGAKSHRDFSTRLNLPDNVQLDKVTAELKNGVLNLVVPKIKPEEKKQVIDVQVD